jgi:hypothetical protein
MSVRGAKTPRNPDPTSHCLACGLGIPRRLRGAE